jgi:hypothetical protein
MSVHLGQQPRGISPLKGEVKEKWQDLCERAANEQDPEALRELVRDINRMLFEKEQRLKLERPAPPA